MCHFRGAKLEMININPKITVVIPSYNRSTLVCRAIKSILRQDYQDFELIIVDDCSRDNTKEIIKPLTNEKIKYIRHSKRKGLAATRNTGIRLSKGEYIAFLDDDDEWMPSKLNKQINYFLKCSDSVGAVYCLYYEQFDYLNYRRKVPGSEMRSGNIYNALLNGWCPRISSSIMLRKKVFEECGCFDENVLTFEDYDFWLRVSGSWQFGIVNEHLAVNHHHLGGHIGNDLEHRIKALELFLEKWQTIIKKDAGKDSYDFIQQKYLSAIYSNEIIENLLNRNLFKAFHFLRQLTRIRRVTLKLLVKASIALTGSRKLFIFAERVFIFLKRDG